MLRQLSEMSRDENVSIIRSVAFTFARTFSPKYPELNIMRSIERILIIT